MSRPAVQFAAPEIDPGDDRHFGFAGTDDGEPSGEYIENLTSLMPQPAAASQPAPQQAPQQAVIQPQNPTPQVVTTTATNHQPFAMSQGQGTASASTGHKQMVQADPVQLERTGQQNLLGIDDDVDVPPFLRR